MIEKCKQLYGTLDRILDFQSMKNDNNFMVTYGVNVKGPIPLDDWMLMVCAVVDELNHTLAGLPDLLNRVAANEVSDSCIKTLCDFRLQMKEYKVLDEVSCVYLPTMGCFLCMDAATLENSRGSQDHPELEWIFKTNEVCISWYALNLRCCMFCNREAMLL